MTEQQIQAYVMGELPPQEAALVAEALAQDPALAEMAREYERIKEGFRQRRVAELQQQLLDYDKTLPAPPTSPAPAAAPKKGNRFWPFGILILAILLGSFVFRQITHYTNEAIAQRYFQAPPDPRVAGEIDSQELFMTAIEDYFAKNYSEAHKVFIQLAAGESHSTDGRLFSPHASFRLKSYSRASVEFANAMNDDNFVQSELQLLRWNNLVNDLALNKEITSGLKAETWPQSYNVQALEEDLTSFWRFKD